MNSYYAIKVIDELNGKEYLLLEEGADVYLRFDDKGTAEEYNYDFQLTLDEMMTSEVVNYSEYMFNALDQLG